MYIFKNYDSEFSYIEVWFTDQNSKPLEIEDKTNIPSVITSPQHNSETIANGHDEEILKDIYIYIYPEERQKVIDDLRLI